LARLIHARDILPNNSIIASTGNTDLMPIIGVRKTAGSNPPATPVIPVMEAVINAMAQTRRRSIDSKFGCALRFKAEQIKSRFAWKRNPKIIRLLRLCSGQHRLGINRPIVGFQLVTFSSRRFGLGCNRCPFITDLGTMHKAVLIWVKVTPHMQCVSVIPYDEVVWLPLLRPVVCASFDMVPNLVQ